MIKKKLITLLSTLSLASVVCVATAVSANAANVELNYNAEKSTATVKVIDVNYEVDAALFSFNGAFEAKCADAVISSYECLVNYTANLQKNGAQAGLDWCDPDFTGDVAASGTHGRLSITVPEGTGAFDVTFSGINTLDAEFNQLDDYAPVTITIPAYKTAVTTAATPVATYTEGEDYDVQTFKATIAAADVAKTLTWTVTANGQSKSDTANIDTNIGGDIEEVIIGLIVQGPSAASATATITVE